LDFDKAISMKSDFALCLINRGIAKFFMSDLYAALKDINQGIELRPNDGPAYYYLALLQFKFDKKDEGCKDLKISSSFGFSDADAKMQELCK
jgi:hypothetical protein